MCHMSEKCLTPPPRVCCRHWSAAPTSSLLKWDLRRVAQQLNPRRAERRGAERRGLRVRAGLLRRCDRKHRAATPPLHSALIPASRRKVDLASQCTLQHRSVRDILYFLFSSFFNIHIFSAFVSDRYGSSVHIRATMP